MFRLRRQPIARRRWGRALSMNSEKATEKTPDPFSSSDPLSSSKTIDELCRMPLGRLLEVFRDWKLTPTERKVAGELTREIGNRVQFLVDVGLDYLTLARPAPSLSGGEMQRIRLAAQVGSGLCGVLYVLDEPTIGLHPRDNRRLLQALHKLRDLGNTLLVVEHDREVVGNADQLLDFGPAAGRQGGYIVAYGTPSQVAKQDGSVTGPYLSGEKAIPVPTNRRIQGREERGEEREEREREEEETKIEARAGPFTTARAGPFTTARAGPFTTARAGPFTTARAGPFTTARAGRFTAQFVCPR